jgi:hypothetical protein
VSLALVRPFVVVDVPQRSPEWAAARLGRLALEQVTGRSHERPFTSPAMQTGAAREAAAVAWYEALTGTLVTTTGFLAHRTHAAGVSLDGHVGDYAGLLEIKCPQVATHVDYCIAGTLPPAHRKQIVHALWITGAPWCDWITFNPEFPPAQRAVVVRVERDRREVAAYALAAALFLREVEAEVAVLARRGVA